MKTKSAKEVSHSEEQAKAQLDSIKEMVHELKLAQEIDHTQSDRERLDVAEQTIQEDPLSVEVRSGWHNPGGEDGDSKPVEFNILLCTGGPAVRIIGTLSEHGEPETARIEHQDWGTPWTEYRITADEEETVLTYCRCFYFGE